MRTRPLGPSEIEASVISLGAWAIGGWMWGGTDEAESIDAIHASIDVGATFIDTAPAYGFGLSETIIGKAVRDRRERVILATKCGMVCNTDRGELKFRSTAMGPDPEGQISVQVYLAPLSVRNEVEGSLRRLQTDYLDLIQTHWQDPTTPIAETMGALLELKAEGKVRAIGVSNASPSQMEEYRAAGQLDVDQERYSLLDRDHDAANLPYCRDSGMAFLAYSPLAQGLLTGKVGPERRFPPDDLRHGKERFSVEWRQKVALLLGRIKPIAQRHGISLGQLAISWALHRPGLTHALCGARSPRQVEENAAASDVTLSDQEIAEIEAAADRYVADIP